MGDRAAPAEIYRESFSRNIGILTEAEQAVLAATTVLIVGTGGIGSNCATILARTGIGRFHLVDPDRFELANINRQVGAKISTEGRAKVEVMEAEITDINPSAVVRSWPEKFSADNAGAVFEGVDICIDAIDFYCIPDHLLLHRSARERGCRVLMGSPVGFSACLQIFEPDGMSLEDYCGIADGMDPVEMQLRYACGLVPRLAHLSYYDVSKEGSQTDFLQGTGPSLASACTLAAALVAGEVVMITLGRHEPRAIPHTLQYDPCTFRNEAYLVEGGMTNYDPSDVLDAVEDKSSLVVNIFDTFYRKADAATLALRDGGELCYRIAGEGPAILFLSAIGGDTSFWSRQVPYFSERYRVITLDNRGVGRSSNLPNGASSVNMAEDVIELITHLQLDRVFLVGCALGSLVAMQVALLRPDLVSGLSLIAAYHSADEAIVETTEEWRQTAQKEGMDAVFDETLEWLFSEDYRHRRRDELAKLKTFYRVNRQDPDEFCKQTIIGNRFLPVRPLWQLECPVQLVHGRQDRLIDARHAQELGTVIDGSELRILDDGGHFLNWELSDRYNQLADRFISTAVHRSGWMADRESGSKSALALSAANFADRLEPLAKDIEIDGRRIHYAETGEGTPIILCHGIPLSMASWQDLFFLLGEHHRVIALDLPGYGRSSKTAGDYSLEGLARLIVGFCDRLGIDRWHVAGSSFGAAVAIELALTAPERVDRLILFNSVGIVGGTHSIERIVRSGLIRFLISRLLIRHSLGKAIFRSKLSASYATIEPDAALVDHYFDLLRRDRGDRSFLSTLRSFNERRLQKKLPRMDRPVLSIWGAEDRVLPVKNSVKLQRLLPHCWSFVLARVGHLPHEEEPAQCARLIDSFLKMPVG